MTEVIELSSPSSGSESSDSETYDSAELREYLNECLASIQSAGSFAVFESLADGDNTPPNPGLCLNNSGLIGLPLCDHDAQAIVAAAHQAPFGKGEKTIVDTSVRNTWEVSPDAFELKNPKWKSFIKGVVAKVSDGLGVDASGRGVTAELYKLLLYEEGAMFKPHQDSEKAPRMFATLVIALPSLHEGGEVRVSHAGKTMVFETSKFSDFDFSYLAWFSDVTHEVKPVLSGRRLVLTYNLIHSSLGAKELAANSNKAMAKLRPLFSYWKNNIEKVSSLPGSLAYLFEHQYTDASLCYDGLKGHDRHVAAHLREVCSEYDFFFYLGNLDRTVSGSCDEYSSRHYHKLEEEFDDETSLEKVVELDGTEVAKGMKFDEDIFIQCEPWEGAEPDDEDFSGYTGNEGVSATHFYHRTVAVLVPRSRRVEFFLNPTATMKGISWRHDELPETPGAVIWLDRLEQDLRRTPKDPKGLDELEQICTMVIRHIDAWKSRPPPKHSWQSEKQPPFSDPVLRRIVEMSVFLHNKTIFVDAFNHCADKMTPSIAQSVGSALLRYGLESLLLTMHANLANVNSFSDRYAIVEGLRTGLEAEAKVSSKDPKIYLEWIGSEINSAVPSMSMASAQDGTILINISRNGDPKDLFNKILPAVKRNIHNTPMAMAFLTGLFDAGAAGEVPENVALSIFKDVISDLVEHFSLSSLGKDSELSNKRQFTGRAWEPQTKPVAAPDIDNSKNIAVLLCHCLTLGLTPELSQIITKIATEAIKNPVELFPILYLPFLKFLLKTLQEREFEKLSTPDSPFCRLFQLLLSIYITRYVRAQPAPPKDWTRPRRGCGCTDCHTLDAFLRAPDKQVGRFPVNKGRRAHLHSRVDGTGLSHETERRGSPQTLVITKNTKEHQAALAAWKERCAVAKGHIGELGTGALKKLLAEIYGPVVTLEVRLLEPAVKALQSENLAEPLMAGANVGNLGNRVLPPVSKRKVPSHNIIVLDD